MGGLRSVAGRRPITTVCAAFSLVFATLAPHVAALAGDAPAAAIAFAAAVAPNLGLVSVKLVPFATGLDNPVAIA